MVCFSDLANPPVRAVDSPTPAKRPRSGERADSRAYLPLSLRSSVRRLESTARTVLTFRLWFWLMNFINRLSHRDSDRWS